MKTRFNPALSSLAVAVLLCATSPVQADVGARVLLQEWNPLSPQTQRVHVLVDNPRLVSDAIQQAWTQVRPRLCTQLRNTLGRGGLAGGQTLRDIDCELDATPAFSVAQSGRDGLTATLIVGGRLTATSTTPTVFGAYADPRFAVALKAKFVLGIAIQPTGDETLRIVTARLTLEEAALDSHGIVADLLKFVADDLVPFFGGPNFKKIAEQAIDSQQVDVKSTFQSLLAPVNVALRGPSQAVRVAVWGRPNAITIAFAPRPLSPPGGGGMTGAIRWDRAAFPSPGACTGFRAVVSVQTGPAPIRDPQGSFQPTDAPKVEVGSFVLRPNAATGECRYEMTGLAAGWPARVFLDSPPPTGAQAVKTGKRLRYVVRGDGWDGHSVLPQPVARDRNFVLTGVVDFDVSAELAQAHTKPVLQVPANPKRAIGIETLATTPRINSSLTVPLAAPAKPAALSHSPAAPKVGSAFAR